MSMTLVLQDVTKMYRSFTAVDKLSFSINKGEIFGLIGQNGAGKTTTFRMILDLQEISGGEILWEGKPIRQIDKDKFGYLPEERGIFQQMKVEEQLYFYGKLRGMKKTAIKEEVDYWINRFELEEKRHVKAETLSKGNQQKVQLIASFIHRPQFLILDEPFSGLDPLNKELLKSAIVYLKDAGTTILFSSHQMENVEDLCDNICLLKNGSPLFTGPIIDLKKKHGKQRLTIRTAMAQQQLLEIDGVTSCERQYDELICMLEDEQVAKTIFELVSENGFIEKFSLDYLTLDEIFRIEVGGRDE